MVNSFAVRLATALALATLAVSITAQQMRYPETRKSDQVDTYFGVRVPDPYRWLEDETSADTARWVEAENKVTFAYLDAIPFRARLKARLTKLYNYPRFGAPYRRGDYFFFSKNDGSTRMPSRPRAPRSSPPWRCRRRPDTPPTASPPADRTGTTAT
jgi:prolyl oligopeptidase